MNDNIIITNKQIISFYQQNPTINIETVNLLFIDMINKLSLNLNESMRTAEMTRIFSAIEEMRNDIRTIDSNFQRIRTDYINDIKLILQNNELTISDKQAAIIERNNNILLLETSKIIETIMPQNTASLREQIEQCIQHQCQPIAQQTGQLIQLHNTSKTSLEITSAISAHFDKIIKPVVAVIENNNKNTHRYLQDFNEQIIQQKSVAEKTNQSISEFCGRYKNNSYVKGEISERDLEVALAEIMPGDIIESVRDITASCDIRVTRSDSTKPTILFENKNYASIIQHTEVAKFERDIKQQQYHGIFISHMTNISGKYDMQIDIKGGLIHLYIANLRDSPYKLRMAINLIDSLSKQLKYFTNKTDAENINWTQSELNALIEDYNRFVQMKLDCINKLKTTVDSYKQLIDTIKQSIEAMDFPIIRGKVIPVVDAAIEVSGTRQLSSATAITLHMCPICNQKFKAGSNYSSSLGTHLRYKTTCQNKYNKLLADEQVPSLPPAPVIEKPRPPPRQRRRPKDDLESSSSDNESTTPMPAAAATTSNPTITQMPQIKTPSYTKLLQRPLPRGPPAIRQGQHIPTPFDPPAIPLSSEK